jgi:hypothetical protein
MAYSSNSLPFLLKKKSRNKIKTSEAEKTGQGGSQTDGKIKLQF